MTIAPAFAPEFSTERGSVGGDVIVATASADLTESIAFYSPAGDEIGDRFNPTTTLAYNMPPLLSHAVLSPDGSELAWLEGPDHNGVTQTVEGDWVLVVADSRSGANVSGRRSPRRTRPSSTSTSTGAGPSCRRGPSRGKPTRRWSSTPAPAGRSPTSCAR